MRIRISYRSIDYVIHEAGGASSQSAANWGKFEVNIEPCERDVKDLLLPHHSFDNDNDVIARDRTITSRSTLSEYIVLTPLLRRNRIVDSYDGCLSLVTVLYIAIGIT